MLFGVLPDCNNIFSGTLKLLNRLNLSRQAGTIMYVQRGIFHMVEKYMICEVDEKRGRMLLEKILLSGNFGHHDERQMVAKNENGVQRLLRRQMRNMRFFGQYAEEVMCVPVYRIY